MTKKITKKKTAVKTKKKPVRAGSKKVSTKKVAATKKIRKVKLVSLIKNGRIYCINSSSNDSPYWGGTTCNESIKLDHNVVKYVCPNCLAQMMPSPKPRNTPKVNPETGEKRRRGRPRKHPVKVVPVDASGNPLPKRGRGRPKGSLNKNKVTAVVKKTTTGKRGRPKGSTNKRKK